MENTVKLGFSELRRLLSVPRDQRLGAIIELNQSEKYFHQIDVIRTITALDRYPRRRMD